MSNASQLEALIAQVVIPLEGQGADIIAPEHVANEVDRLLDPSSTAPDLKTYSSMMNIRGLVRKYLAKRHDPVDKAEEYAAGITDDLFGGETRLSGNATPA